MNYKVPFIIFLTLISWLPVSAQIITKYDTIDKIPLLISMDSRVNKALLDVVKDCDKNETNEISAPAKILVPNRELSTAEICRRNPRVQGFKIQFAVVKSNAEANELKSDFRSKFPQFKVVTDASLRPNYKLLAGSYFSKQSAASDLSKIRQQYPSAVVISYSIFCVEGK